MMGVVHRRDGSVLPVVGRDRFDRLVLLQQLAAGHVLVAGGGGHVGVGGSCGQGGILFCSVAGAKIHRTGDVAANFLGSKTISV